MTGKTHWIGAALIAAIASLAPAQPANPLAQPANPLTRPEQAPAAAAEVLRLRKTLVHDPEGGCDAFSVLAPAEWKIEPRFLWRLHTSDPCQIYLHVYNPAALQELTLFPSMRFVSGVREDAFALQRRFGLSPIYRSWDEVWANIQRQFPDGGIYQCNEIRGMPPDPAAFIRDFVLPRCRPELRDYRLASVQDLPKIAEAFMARASEVAGYQAWSTRARLEYDLNGRPVEEDFFFTIYRFPSRVGSGQVAWWGTDGVLSYRADRGQLDTRSNLFNAIQHSLRPTPEWFNVRSQVAAICVRMANAQLRTAFQISQIRSGVNSTISDAIWEQYRKNQASSDRVQKNWVQTIRGVDEYQHPFEDRPIELPSGYENAWVNGSGEIILSNEIGFDPNIGSIREWRRMQRNEQ